jgi:hypothetical protein
MIFNHNIVQRSDRILFDNGYTHEKLGGKFRWDYGGTDDNAQPIIGETIRLMQILRQTQRSGLTQ